jgi:hypothetical protein
MGHSKRTRRPYIGSRPLRSIELLLSSTFYKPSAGSAFRGWELLKGQRTTGTVPMTGLIAGDTLVRSAGTVKPSLVSRA